MNVYKAINAVQSELTKIGITKDGRNTQGAGYNFRGIDQVYNTLSPLLSKHGLCILPRVTKSEQTERTSSKGGVLIYSYVTMEFDLVSAEDGSKHTICTVGEAFDSGDKSMNKAMSAAYKYAAFQAFAIPTEGDNDADAHTHEIASVEAMPPEVLADWLLYINESSSVGELKSRVAEAEKNAESDTKALVEIRAAAAAKMAKAKSQKESV